MATNCETESPPPRSGRGPGGEVLALLLALACTGCLTSTYQTQKPANGGEHTESAPFFLWGLVGDKTVDLHQVCPQGVANWYDQQTFADGLLECLTCGIYSPRTIVVRCAGGPSYQLQPKPEQHMTWVVPLSAGEGG